LNDMQNRLASGIERNLKGLNQDLDRLAKRVKDPRKRLADTWMRLDEIHTRLARVMDLIVRDRRIRLSMEKRSLLLHSPLNVMVSIKQRLDFQRNSLGYAMNSCLGEKQVSLSLLEKRINDLSPLSILKRGYSITRRLPEKIVLRDASDVKREEQVQVLLAKGRLECRVEKLESD